MDIDQKLIKSSILRTASFILQLMVAFFMTPVIIHSLGDRMYGFWTLISTFIGYYGLLDLGLSSAVGRYISQALGKNDLKEMNKVVNTSFFLFTLIGVVVLFISLIAVIFCFYFIKSPEEKSLFRNIIILMGISIAIGFPMRVFAGILTSYLRYDLFTYASVIRLLIATTFIYYLLKIGYGIMAFTIVTFFASLLEYTLILIFSKKTFPQLRISHSLYRKDKVKLLFRYSGKTFIAHLADILRFKVDVFVIVSFLSLNLVTYYAVGARLIEYFTQFIMSSVGFMSPVFSQYEGRGDFDSIRKIFLQVTKISVVLSVFVGTSIIYYGKAFIQRWLGSNFESSYYVAVILCIPYIMALMQNPSIGLLYGISKHHFYAVINICEGIMNLFLSIILVRYYGIYGVALGTAIEMLLFKIFIQPIFICRAINLSLYEYYSKTLFVTTIKTLAPLLFYFYMIKNFLKADYTSIVVAGAVQILLFVPIVFFFILDKKEKQFIKSVAGMT